MADRVDLSVEVPGLRVDYSGDPALFDEVVKGMLAPVARGGWRAAPSSAAGIARAEAAPADLLPAPTTPGPAPDLRAPALAVPAPPPAPAPRESAAAQARAAQGQPYNPLGAPPAAFPRATGAAAFDPTPLYAALAKEDRRRADRDAVLLALVALAASGKRDSTPAEITGHIAAGGFPAEDLHARPILAKLSHRKGLAAPGVLPGTFRATPAGVAYILRRARGA
jgi:hypothetical protein